MLVRTGFTTIVEWNSIVTEGSKKKKGQGGVTQQIDATHYNIGNTKVLDAI